MRTSIKKRLDSESTDECRPCKEHGHVSSEVACGNQQSVKQYVWSRIVASAEVELNVEE